MSSILITIISILYFLANFFLIKVLGKVDYGVFIQLISISSLSFTISRGSSYLIDFQVLSAKQIYKLILSVLIPFFIINSIFFFLLPNRNILFVSIFISLALILSSYNQFNYLRRNQNLISCFFDSSFILLCFCVSIYFNYFIGVDLLNIVFPIVIFFIELLLIIIEFKKNFYKKVMRTNYETKNRHRNISIKNQILDKISHLLFSCSTSLPVLISASLNIPIIASEFSLASRPLQALQILMKQYYAEYTIKFLKTYKGQRISIKSFLKKIVNEFLISRKFILSISLVFIFIIIYRYILFKLNIIDTYNEINKEIIIYLLSGLIAFSTGPIGELLYKVEKHKAIAFASFLSFTLPTLTYAILSNYNISLKTSSVFMSTIVLLSIVIQNLLLLLNLPSRKREINEFIKP